jgi:hypothetical protein
MIVGLCFLLSLIALIMACRPIPHTPRWTPPPRCIARSPEQGVYLTCDRLFGHDHDHFNVATGKSWQ